MSRLHEFCEDYGVFGKVKRDGCWIVIMPPPEDFAGLWALADAMDQYGLMDICKCESNLRESMILALEYNGFIYKEQADGSRGYVLQEKGLFIMTQPQEVGLLLAQQEPRLAAT
jgi:hypothetical protein